MKLYPFQEKYLAGLPDAFIFSADTGTGKTVMALEHYRRTAFPKPLLILGPAAKMRTGDWERHVAEFFGEYGPEVHCYSYEKFSRNPTLAEYAKKGETSVWRHWLGTRHENEFAVIADEVHRCANAQSGIGRVAFEISRHTRHFIGLSATPLPNSWVSAANYFKIFGFAKNITEFKKRYCNFQTFKGFPELVGYFHEDELKSYWHRISKPLRKGEALELPQIVDVPVRFETAKEYTQVRKEMVFGDRLLDNPSAMLHALRQSTMAPKLPWLDEFLDGVSSNVVIFYNYVAEREAILAMLAKSHKKRRVFRQDGEKHELPDKSGWERLERTITLAQYQSGSTGVEMTYADTIVFFSPTYSFSTYHQAVGRIERIGQGSHMTLYSLCAPATIEKDVWDCIRGKRDFQEQVWIRNNVLQKP